MNTDINNTNEIWKVIENYPNYEVSNLGRVRNIQTKHILNPRITNRGYYRVALYDGNKTFINKRHGKDIPIHLLVLSAFVPKPKGNYEVDHINLNKFDNRLENLRWVTRKENLKSRSTSRLVGKYDVETEKLIKVFETLKDAADDAGIPPTTLQYKINNNKPVRLYTIYKFL